MTDILAVMVKDGARTLSRCLGSASGAVGSMLVVDTGSTDSTREIAAQCGAEVVERPWIGYAANRTELLGMASARADRILHLDADMVFEGQLPVEEGVDCWRANMVYGGLSYRLPFLLSARKPWVYRGVIHEWLDCADSFTSANTDEFTIYHPDEAGGRERLDSDLGLLLDAGAGEPRNIYYLAQTYKDMGRYAEAISLYRARAELGGYEEERWHSLYQAGCLLCAHVSFAEGAPLLLEAWKQRPSRAEPLRALATSAMHVADKIPFPEDDDLFVDLSAYADAPDSSPPA